MAYNLTLSNVTVKGNKTTEENGFIFISNTQGMRYVNVNIDFCQFSENTNELGFGGIYIENTSSDVTTGLYVTATDMSNNTAKQGAAIYVSIGSLTDDSCIRESTFHYNDSDNRGVLFISFASGIMEISDNSFENNTGT